MSAPTRPVEPKAPPRRGRSGYAKAGADCRTVRLTDKGHAAVEHMWRNRFRRAFGLPPVEMGEDE